MRRHVIIVVDRGVVCVHLPKEYRHKESEVAYNIRYVGCLPPPAVGAVIIFIDDEGDIDEFVALGDPYLDAFLKVNHKEIKKIVKNIFKDQTTIN